MKDKLFKFFNKNINIILFIVEFLLSIFSIFFLYKYSIHNSDIYCYLFYISVVLLVIDMIFLLKSFYKKLEYLFLIFIIPIGFGYMFLMIPDYVPDEISHIHRTYSVAEFNFFPKKDKKNIPIIKVPKYLMDNSMDKKNMSNYKHLSRVLHSKTNYNKKVKTYANNMARYFFGCYLIPSIGINIGKLFNLPIYLSIYLGRFLNLLLFIGCGFLILKHIPFGKLLMFVYLLTPMMLQQATSVSADTIVNISALCFVSYLMYLKFNDNIKELSLKRVLILIFLMLIVGLSKVVYFPIILLIFLLYEKIKNSKKREKYLLYFFVILSILGSFIFNSYVSKYAVQMDYYDLHNIDVAGQLEYVIFHPLKYLTTLLTTLNINSLYIDTFMGESLGWLNIKGSSISTMVLVVLFVIAPFLEKSKLSFKRKEKCFVNFIVFITFNVILGVFYLIYTDLYKEIIEGIQGRYFIPIVFISMLTLVCKKKNIVFKRTNLTYFVLLLLININSLYSIFLFFNK